MATDSIRGTEFKLNVRMEPIDGKYHLSNIDWEVELSTRKVGSKAQIIKKEQARKVTATGWEKFPPCRSVALVMLRHCRSQGPAVL